MFGIMFISVANIKAVDHSFLFIQSHREIATIQEIEEFR